MAQCDTYTLAQYAHYISATCSVHTCSYSCAHSYLHTDTRIYIRAHTQTYRKPHTHTHTHTHTYTHILAHTVTHILVRTHTHHTRIHTIIRRLLTFVPAQTTHTSMRMHIFLRQAQHIYHTYIDHLFYHISYMLYTVTSYFKRHIPEASAAYAQTHHSLRTCACTCRYPRTCTCTRKGTCARTRTCTRT